MSPELLEYWFECLGVGFEGELLPAKFPEPEDYPEANYLPEDLPE